MAFPESFLEDLKSRTDIVDVVSDYVQLQKKGGRYWGCCPFHSEKTPSFSVRPEQQMYYCFGCHKGGGVINFVMEQEAVPYQDAVAILAKRAGLPLPESGEDAGLRKRRERLLSLNKEAARYFHKNLSLPEAEPGRRYLLKRGLSKGTITNFGMGYALQSWDALLNAMTDKGYTKRELLDVGLCVASEKGSVYDRFRGRVIFPIIDLRGNVIGFGGRVLDDSKPKYLNSPDSIVYNKSRNLFAMNLAKKSKAGKIILTEGYMDTISLHQGGFDYAVASLGTSLTEEHARLLAKYTKEIILSYDGDAAGVSAAQRAIGILTKVGLNVKVLRMTGAKDPDEFIKKNGRNAFQHLLDGSENQIDYRILQIQQKYDLKNDEQRVAYLQEAAQMIAHLSSPVEREVYGGRAAAAAGIDKKVMKDEVERQRQRTGWQQKKKAERRMLTPAANYQPEERRFRYQNPRSARAEEGVIRLVMLEDTLFELTGSLSSAQFSSEVLAHIYDLLLRRWEAGQSLDPDLLSMELPPEEMSLLTKILQDVDSSSNREAALRDYVHIIQAESSRRSFGKDSSDQDLMRLFQQKNRANK